MAHQGSISPAYFPPDSFVAQQKMQDDKINLDQNFCLSNFALNIREIGKL